MKVRAALVVIIVCLAAIFFACRRNTPSLVDANRPPETELWYAPPDSTEYDYLVHLYWRGVDVDGIPVRYIWTIQDTLVPGPLGWNPSQRVRDFRSGRITTRTDSVFSFTAFRNVGGVGLRKNRQAFLIAAIDDNGVIDPSPAAIEFVATVQRLPEMRFQTAITRIKDGQATTVTKPYNPANIDTVGMFRPFEITYNGVTTNGQIRAYKFFPLTSGVALEGADVWNEDLTDTLRVFPNTGPDALPSGRFRFAAQVRDDAGAESRVDASGFQAGVVQVVVNFEPDTEIFEILNTSFIGNQTFVEQIDFTDSTPDTVQDRSFITLFYRGVDNPSDSSLCQDVVNECLTYQVQYRSFADVDGGPAAGGFVVDTRIGWQPLDPEDSNEFGTSDSTTLNIGSFRYELNARAVDEYGKGDGTPAQVEIVGNFRPSLETLGVESYDGTLASDGDTLVWDWWNPANLGPLKLPSDTLDFSDPTNPRVFKEFYFVIRGTGQDDPRERTDSGVKSWLYSFITTGPNPEVENFARAGFWSDGIAANSLADTVRYQVRYSLITDPGGVQAFAERPTYLDTEYDFTLRGRDSGTVDEFEQIMFLNGESTRLNVVNASRIGRLTEERAARVYLTLER